MIGQHLENDYLVLELDNRFILNNGSLYDQLLSSISQYNKKKIILDFSRVTTIDEWSLKTLLKLVDQRSSRGYSFSLRGPAKSILKKLVNMEITDKIRVLVENKPGLSRNIEEKV